MNKININKIIITAMAIIAGRACGADQTLPTTTPVLPHSIYPKHFEYWNDFLKGVDGFTGRPPVPPIPPVPGMPGHWFDFFLESGWFKETEGRLQYTLNKAKNPSLMIKSGNSCYVVCLEQGIVYKGNTNEIIGSARLSTKHLTIKVIFDEGFYCIFDLGAFTDKDAEQVVSLNQQTQPEMRRADADDDGFATPEEVLPSRGVRRSIMAGPFKLPVLTTTEENLAEMANFVPFCVFKVTSL